MSSSDWSDDDLPALPSQKQQIMQSIPTTTTKKAVVQQPDDDSDFDDDDDNDDFLPILPSQKQVVLPTQIPKTRSSTENRFLPPMSDDGNDSIDYDDDDDDDFDLPSLPSQKPVQLQEKSTAMAVKPKKLHTSDDDDDSDFGLPSLPSQAQATTKPIPQSIINNTKITIKSNRDINPFQYNDDDFTDDDVAPQKFEFVDTAEVQPTPILFSTEAVSNAAASALPFTAKLPSALTSTNDHKDLPEFYTTATSHHHAPPPPVAVPVAANKPKQPLPEFSESESEDWEEPLTNTTQHKKNTGILPCGCHCTCSPHNQKAPETDPFNNAHSRLFRISQHYLSFSPHATHFDPQREKPVCDNCDDEAATACYACDEFLCDFCSKVIHLRASRKKTHKRVNIATFLNQFIQTSGQNCLNTPTPTTTTVSHQQTVQSNYASQKSQSFSPLPQSQQPLPLSSDIPPSSATKSKQTPGPSLVSPEDDQLAQLDAERSRAEDARNAEEERLRRQEILAKRREEKEFLLKQKRAEREARLKEKENKKKLTFGDDDGVIDKTKDIYAQNKLNTGAPIVIVTNKKEKQKIVKQSTKIDDFALPPPPPAKEEAAVKKSKKKPEAHAEKASAPAKKKQKYTDDELFGFEVSSKSKEKSIKKQESDQESDEPRKKITKAKKTKTVSSDEEPFTQKRAVVGKLAEASKVKTNDDEDQVSSNILSNPFGSTRTARAKKSNIFDEDEEDPATFMKKKFGKKNSGPF